MNSSVNPLQPLRALTSEIRQSLQDANTIASALKAIRQYAALGFEDEILELKFEFSLVWILTGSDSRSREAALKTLQSIQANRSVALPKSCLCCLISIGETVNDPLRLAAVEILCEAAVIYPQIAFESGVIKFLFSCLVDGPKELLDCLILTALYLLDSSETRQFIRPNVELEIIVSYFSEFNVNSKIDDQRLLVCSRVLIHLMKSWTGMLYLSGENLETIVSIISALKVPVKWFREHLISTFYSIISLPDGADPYIYLKRPNLSFIFHFRAMQVIILLEAGLLDVIRFIS